MWLSSPKKIVQEITDFCNLGVMSQDNALVIKTLKGSELIAESQNLKKMKNPTPSKLTEEKEHEASLPGRVVLPIA